MTGRELPSYAVRKPTKGEIGAWLREAREAARDRAAPEGKSQYAQAGIAERLGVRERAVRMWEKGRTAPPADKFLELVLFYRADVGELLATRYVKGAASGVLSAAEERKRKLG